MSEIKKRRKAFRFEGRTCATYEIDATLFAKDSGIIYLPNPKDVDRYKDPNWNDVILTDNVWPWLPTALYNTIKQLGYFVFIYKEFYADENYCRWNLVICEDGAAGLLRYEDKDGNVIPDRKCRHRGVIIRFYEDYYMILKMDLSHIEDRTFKYRKNNTLDGIDVTKTDLTGFNIVETYLKNNKQD